MSERKKKSLEESWKRISRKFSREIVPNPEVLTTSLATCWLWGQVLSVSYKDNLKAE